jgi:type I restriction enzyme, R subunit
VKLGSIVLIKTENEGVEQTLVFDLTDDQRQNLEKNEFIMNKPRDLMKYLTG